MSLKTSFVCTVSRVTERKNFYRLAEKAEATVLRRLARPLTVQHFPFTTFYV